MKHFQFITGKYNKDRSITVFASDGLKVYPLKIIGFDSYIYVPINDPIPDLPQITNVIDDPPFIHEEGFQVKKIVTITPDVVPEIRAKFSSHYEADIKFIRRFLIDTGIKNGFLIYNDNLDRPIHYTELIPCDFTTPLVIAYVDFEIRTTTRFANPHNPQQPVTAWTVWNNRDRTYTQVVLSKDNRIEEWSPDHTVAYVSNEEALFTLWKKYLEDVQPHIIVHWYGKVADIEYPYYRARKFGIEIPYNHSDQLDLSKAYEKIHHKLFYRLKDVAVEEGIFEPSELVSDQFRKDLEAKDLKTFTRYNFMDTQIMVILDQLGWMKLDEETGQKKLEPPKQLCEFFWDLKTFVGLEKTQSAIANSVLIDALMLRKAYGNFILNSSHEYDRDDREESSLKGGIVFEPKEGIEENLAILDMSRYYPNIILAYKIDKLACQILTDLFNKRDEFEALMIRAPSINSPEYKYAEKKRDQVKYIVNTTWGYLASKHSRKYNKAKADKIIEKTRLGLMVIKAAAESKGVVVVYGDTDCLDIKTSSELETANIIHYLNEEVLKEHCHKEGIPTLLKLKYEKFAKRALFVKTKTGKKAAKKRYALHICFASLKKNVIWTTRGKNKPITEVKIGDRLIAYDTKKSQFVETEVKQIIERDCNNYLRITIDKNDSKKGCKPAGGEANPIIVTSEHPFYLHKKWVHADELNVGDELLFVSKSDKQLLQLKYEEGFKKRIASQTGKPSYKRTKKQRERISDTSKNLWLHKRTDMIASLKKGHTEESTIKFRKTCLERGVFQNTSERMKLHNPLDNPTYRQRCVKNRLKRPSFLESIVQSIIQEEKLSLEYIGDGKFWVGSAKRDRTNGRFLPSTTTRRMNPDFKVIGQKKVVEVYALGSFGRGISYEKERTEHYEKFGIECLVLGLNIRNIDREQTISSLNQFVHNGVKIANIRPSRVRYKRAINFRCEPYNNFFVNGVLVHNCWENGRDTDYIDIVGFDYIRGNASKVTRRIQMQNIKSLLKGDKTTIPAYLRGVIKDIRSNKYSIDDLSIPVTLSKPLDKYIKTKPDYVTGSMWSTQHLGLEIIGGDRIKMIYCLRPTGVICYFDSESLPSIVLDYDKIIDRTVKKKSEQFLRLAGINWREVEGSADFKKWFNQ